MIGQTLDGIEGVMTCARNSKFELLHIGQLLRLNNEKKDKEKKDKEKKDKEKKDEDKEKKEKERKRKKDGEKKIIQHKDEGQED